ncbi:MAG: hypothetical protein K9L61_01440 [Candidatus Omnitrophica bacterium]|nr:hypothetical protein [Candidatus Omnitrophota bacterium]
MKILALILVSLLITVPIWAKDPFESILPKEKKQGPAQQRRFEEEILLPDWVVVEGVLWGTESPQTIIDGEVYFIGDKIKNLDATVFKIKENIVFISYAGKIFKKEVKKREAR